MGTEKASKKKIKRFKRLVTALLVAVLFLAPVLCEVAYIFDFIPKSPSSELLKAFGASPTDDDSEFIEFLSVGQADCTVIKSKNFTAVIDFGLPDESDAIYNRLSKLGVKDVDLAVVTHNDTDHLGGYFDLAENIKIDKLLINDFSDCDDNKALYDKAIKIAKSKKTEILSPNVNDIYKIGNADLKILYSNPLAKKSNNKSIVMMLTLCGKRILFTGDLEDSEENKLQLKVADLDCDILKLGHHGSAYSTSSEFLKRTTPKIAIASCGYDNLYNHPSDKVRARLKEFGVKLYRTDLDENLRCEIKREKVTIFKIS